MQHSVSRVDGHGAACRPGDVGVHACCRADLDADPQCCIYAGTCHSDTHTHLPADTHLYTKGFADCHACADAHLHAEAVNDGHRCAHAYLYGEAFSYTWRWSNDHTHGEGNGDSRG